MIDFDKFAHPPDPLKNKFTTPYTFLGLLLAVYFLLLLYFGPIDNLSGFLARKEIEQISLAANHGGSVPQGLPNHFMLGIANRPERFSWMREANVPFDARYQYLVADLRGTSNNWVYWSSNGNFPVNYISESYDNGYFPVFTYYVAVPTADYSESQRLFDLLNNRTEFDMYNYYKNWKLLMDKISSTGKSVIVHLEPDVWASMHNRFSASDDPATTSVQVALTGDDTELNSMLSGLPNNLSGFAQALVRIRDQRAPKVVLAYHINFWQGGADIGSSSNCGVSTQAHADKIATFMNRLGGGWGLFFTDPLDRDAGWWELVMGSDRWWHSPASDSHATKPTYSGGQICPNFEKMKDWHSKLSQALGKRGMMWQVPIGNYHYKTVNNTDNHYEDNRAQYFLEDYPSNPHIREWAQAGLIGILFGKGCSGSACNGTGISPTDYRDAAGDGVTNPPAYVRSTGVTTPSNLGNSSSHSDDDGGYIRLRAKSYYDAGPATLPGVQVADSDGDGCTDSQEQGSDEILGGRRDPNNPYDFFDTPPKDKAVTASDINRVVQRFGTYDEGPPNSSGFSYDSAFDRSYVGPNTWDLGPPNGSITAQDIQLIVNQFGHSCIEQP